jgi:hypothetical protein
MIPYPLSFDGNVSGAETAREVRETGEAREAVVRAVEISHVGMLREDSVEQRRAAAMRSDDEDGSIDLG